MSEEREYEMKQITEFFDKKILTKDQLISFYDIIGKVNSGQHTVAIIGDFTYGTGNSTTAIRLRKIMRELGYKCFIYNLNVFNDLNEGSKTFLHEINKLEIFLANNRVSLILGIGLITIRNSPMESRKNHN